MGRETQVQPGLPADAASSSGQTNNSVSNKGSDALERVKEAMRLRASSVSGAVPTQSKSKEAKIGGGVPSSQSKAGEKQFAKAKNAKTSNIDDLKITKMRTYEFTMMAFVGLAVLAVALSPLHTDVSFIGEAVLAAFYIDFDLYTKAPPVPIADGGETLLEEVMKLD